MIQKKSLGFTLIELMIVVAIIGVLVAISAPFYQAYIKRAIIAEGLSLINGLKAPVIEHLTVFSKCPNNVNMPGGQEAQTAIDPPEKITGKYVTKVRVIPIGFGPGYEVCQIEAFFKKGIFPTTFSGISLITKFKGTNGQMEGPSKVGAYRWVCYAPDIPPEYLPKNCIGKGMGGWNQ